jgi:predicted nucleic-acid-binding protein
LFVSLVVLCEMVWVLESAYRHRKVEIVAVLDELLATGGFEIERRDVVRAALDDFRATKADFADAVIGRTNQVHGCHQSLTFERSLKALETFRVL